MTRVIPHPTVTLEGRAPLPGGQIETRQTYIPKELARLAVTDGVAFWTVYIDPHDAATYDANGRIQSYAIAGMRRLLHETLEPGSYAWRLRDPVWEQGDPCAYPSGQGYNSQRVRTELATRRGFGRVLGGVGMAAHGVAIIAPQDVREAGFTLFCKPDRVNDISDDSAKRARLVGAAEAGAMYADGAVFQQRELLMPAQTLADHLGVVPAALDPAVQYLHAVRVYSPLWLPHDAAPAVELRLSHPNAVGRRFPTRLHLLEPEFVRGRLPALARLHAALHTAFAGRYGEQNYLAFDYLLGPDGSVKVLNGLARALTPNLDPGQQRPEVMHLARATADVEVRQLAHLALSRVR